MLTIKGQLKMRDKRLRHHKPTHDLACESQFEKMPVEKESLHAAAVDIVRLRRVSIFSRRSSCRDLWRQCTFAYVKYDVIGRSLEPGSKVRKLGLQCFPLQHFLIHDCIQWRSVDGISCRCVLVVVFSIVAPGSDPCPLACGRMLGGSCVEGNWRTSLTGRANAGHVFLSFCRAEMMCSLGEGPKNEKIPRGQGRISSR